MELELTPDRETEFLENAYHRALELAGVEVVLNEANIDRIQSAIAEFVEDSFAGDEDELWEAAVKEGEQTARDIATETEHQIYEQELASQTAA